MQLISRAFEYAKVAVAEDGHTPLNRYGVCARENMKTNQYTNCIWHVSTLVTAVWLAMTSVGIGAASNETVSTPQAAASTNTSSVPIYTPHAYGELLYFGNEIPEQRKRVDELVASLKQESWDQSRGEPFHQRKPVPRSGNRL